MAVNTNYSNHSSSSIPLTNSGRLTLRLAAPLQFDSIVDGEGLRTVLWTQGCHRHCPGCHNPHTHDIYAGVEVDLEEIKTELAQAKLQQGITFSGGEPFLQPQALLELARFVKKELGWDVWSWSGFRYEELNRTSEEVAQAQAESNHNCQSPNFMQPYDPDAVNLAPYRQALLKEIDVLVDGPFILAQRDLSLLFRGSKNQRLLRLQDGKIISIE